MESSWFVVVGLRCMVQFAVPASRLGVDRPAVERNRARAAVPHAHAWGYVLSPLRGLGEVGQPGNGACAAIPHAYAWGYVLSPLRGLQGTPRSLAPPGNALPWRLCLLEPHRLVIGTEI